MARFKVLETPLAQYRELVERLPEAKLAKKYRPSSWTVRQLVHHVMDIQLLNFLRLNPATGKAVKMIFCHSLISGKRNLIRN